MTTPPISHTWHSSKLFKDPFAIMNRIIKLLRRVGIEFFYTVEVPHPYKDRTMFITKEVA